MIFINGENKIIFDVSGHRKPHKIMTILNYISTKSYENNMSLEEFRDEEAFEKDDDE
jgi:thioredoxin-related protein